MLPLLVPCHQLTPTLLGAFWLVTSNNLLFLAFFMEKYRQLVVPNILGKDSWLHSLVLLATSSTCWASRSPTPPSQKRQGYGEINASQNDPDGGAGPKSHNVTAAVTHVWQSNQLEYNMKWCRLHWQALFYPSLSEWHAKTSKRILLHSVSALRCILRCLNFLNLNTNSRWI